MEWHDIILWSVLGVLLALHELRRVVERMQSDRQDREQRDTEAHLAVVMGLR